LTVTITVSAKDADGATASAAAVVTQSGSLADMTALAATLGYAANRLQWNEPFVGPTLDATKWIPDIADQNGIWRKSVPAPLSAANSGGFAAEYYDPAQLTLNNGLTITAVRSTAQAGYTWKSGCICTHGKLAIPSGLVLVKMQQPDSSSGMWPSVWMLEGGGEIDIQEGGYISGNVPNRAIARNLHTCSNSQVIKDTGVDLSAGYNIFGMEYKPGVSVKTFLNGTTIATYTSSVPTGAYTLLLNLMVAQNATWHSALSTSTPSPSVMRVAGVQWYQ
jgi:beta-glucanase (GH16 family)